MKILIVCALISLLSIPNTFCQVTVPGEWEPHESIWITYQTESADTMYDAVMITIIRHLANNVNTNVLVERKSENQDMQIFFANHNIDTSRVRIVPVKSLSMWIRDYGPHFVFSNSNQPSLVSFKYSFYHNLINSSKSGKNRDINKINKKFACLTGSKRIRSELVLEGGAFETNGEGTIILVESLVENRNKSLSRQEIEDELRKQLGIKSFLWLKHGLAQDPYGSVYYGDGFFANGTGGHTDHFIRFANDSTLLLYQETITTPNTIGDLNVTRMNTNLRAIENFTDHRGKKFKVIKIPSPGIFYESKPINKDLKAGLRLPDNQLLTDSIKKIAATGYLNYLITNGLIILPKYGVETDAHVKAIFDQIFPEREIVQVNPMVLNKVAGGIHCIYLQQPLMRSF